MNLFQKFIAQFQNPTYFTGIIFVAPPRPPQGLLGGRGGEGVMEGEEKRGGERGGAKGRGKRGED